jgi:3-hydroxyisobutyrate dehydrogenase-like beta-hydroxyacid dehydrogenase
MGYEMAKNVRQKMPSESTLFINDVAQAQCEKFVKDFQSLGAIEIVKTAREIAENSSIIVSIVPAATHVQDVYINDKTGVIAATPNPNRLILECSTIDSETAIELGTALKAAEAGTYIDTPVSVSSPAHI